jgi:hypothetical protein
MDNLSFYFEKVNIFMEYDKPWEKDCFHVERGEDVMGRQSFDHAQVSKGTNLSTFDPFWRRKIYGFKKNPTPE